MNAHDVFRKLAHKTGEVAGSPYAFSGALLVIIAWALLGEQFEYSDTWQLVINTGKPS
jgi:low affinity Fe/Cu permease